MMDFDTYLSPFSWRYGSAEMREIWSETHKRRLWRRIWVALAQAQVPFELVSHAQVSELSQKMNDIDITRALQIESEIHHDLMAEVKVFAEQCPSAAGIIHLGATSMDIEDNADAIRLRDSLGLLIQRLENLLSILSEQMLAHADTPVMAFTHLQPAEPTTLGYRLGFYGQDLLESYLQLKQMQNSIRGKGFKGAVGTAASYIELLGANGYLQFEQSISDALSLPFYPLSNQTYPRLQDYNLISSLAGVGSILYKFAFDLRLLQSPPVGELAEPFGRKQIGSSAMPFKRNPIRSEKMDSLGRLLSQLPAVAWGNAAHSLLERTLDDSANRRTILPEAFLIVDEMLQVSTGIISGLQINLAQIERNFMRYAPFAATERVLMAAVKNGADRQEMHHVLRENALAAWEKVQIGEENPLLDLLMRESRLLSYLDPEQIIELFSVDNYVGIAPGATRALAGRIRAVL